jgi:hypothetical protein
MAVDDEKSIAPQPFAELMPAFGATAEVNGW